MKVESVCMSQYRPAASRSRLSIACVFPSITSASRSQKAEAQRLKWCKNAGDSQFCDRAMR